jgi:hypothetical protein
MFGGDKTMRTVVYVFLGLILASLIAALFAPVVVWVAAPLLALALTLLMVHMCLYRPPEDHVGVVYKLGRFSRLVEPDEWVITLPGIHETKKPISLHARRLDAAFTEVPTKDQMPVDCKLVVFYQCDLRHADAALRTEALSMPDQSWNTVVGTALRECVEEVVSDIPFSELLSAEGRARLRQRLGQRLGRRVRPMGVLVNSGWGISVQMLRPAMAIWQAMLELSAAGSLGEAALARVRPMLQEVSERHPEVSWEALLLEWASVVAKDGTVPQMLVAPDQALVAADLASRSQRQPGGGSTGKQGIAGVNGKREGNLTLVSAWDTALREALNQPQRPGG